MAKNDPDDIKKKALETASIVEDALKSIAGKIGDIFEQALSGSDKVTQATAKEIQSRFNRIAKVTDDIASNALKLKQGLLDVKKVKDQILQRETQLESLGIQLVTLMKQQGIQVGNINELIELSNDKSSNLTKKQRELVNEYLKTKEINGEYINQLNEQISAQEKINKKLGFTGKLLLGTTKIPFVGQFIEADKVLAAMNAKIAAGGNRFSVFLTGLKAIGGSMISNLLDPMTLLTGGITLAVKAFKFLLDLGFKVDAEITDLSKSMGVSYGYAEKTRNEFKQIQNSSKNALLTTENQVKAQLQLAEAAGATRGFTHQQIQDQIYLTKQLGLSEEEAGSIQQLMQANGMTAKQITQSVTTQTSSLAKQTGIQFNNQKVLATVAKISGAIRTDYYNNPALLAKAVVQVQKLGINLEQAKKMAKGLLDFEQSIENELSAEVITGKSLNLERARLLALNKDSAGAVEEMLTQIGGISEYNKLNVVQQESLAKVMGMEVDELSDSLIKREQLNNLGKQTRDQIEKEIAAAKKLGDMDKVRMLENSIGNDEDAQAALERIKKQEQFNNAIEKFKNMLTSIVEGPAQDLLNAMMAFITNNEKMNELSETLKSVFDAVAFVANNIKTIMVAIGAVMAASMVGSMVKMAAAFPGLIARATTLLGIQTATAAASTTTNAAVTFGVGTVAIIAAVAAVMGALGAYTMMKDGMIGPDGGLVVSGEKGTYKLDKNDSIIAGTDLGKPITSGGGKGTSSVNIDALVVEQQRTNSLLSQILSKEGKVDMDSTRVGTSLNMGTYKVQ